MLENQYPKKVFGFIEMLIPFNTTMNTMTIGKSFNMWMAMHGEEYAVINTECETNGKYGKNLNKEKTQCCD